MKVKVVKEVLLKSLAHLQSVVERKNTIPILANVKISTATHANQRGIMLYATDMDVALNEFFPAEIYEDGEITVPAHTFFDIVRKLPGETQISMEYSESSTSNRLNIITSFCNFTLPVISAEDFPLIDITEVSHKFKINRDEFHRIINKTRFAVSTEETRYYLNGIFLHAVEVSGESYLRSAATDGHRLAQVQTQAPKEASDIPSIIIPRKTVSEIKKLLEEDFSDSEIELEISKSKIKISIANVILISKLIDATYPDYERVIPKGNNFKLDIKVKSFVQAIDRVATIASEKSRAIKFILNENKLVISANNVDTGFAQEELEVSYDGQPIETGFNAKYLMEVASILEGENASLFFADNSAPTLINDPEDKDAVFVIMPMRI